MRKIDYIKILKNAWHVIWQNKFLWWFGLFLALGGGTGFNFPAGNFQFGRQEEMEEKIFEQAGQFLEQYWQIFAALGILIFAVFLALLVLKIISRAGLIKSVDDIEKRKPAGFRQGFREGKKYFWKIFLTGIVISFFVFFVIFSLVLPVAFLVYLKSYALAVILGIAAFLIVTILAVSAGFVGEYAYIYLVLSGISVRWALENACQLFLRNIWPSVIFALVFLVIGMAVGLALLMAFFVLALVFVPLGYFLYLAFAKVGIAIAAALGDSRFFGGDNCRPVDFSGLPPNRLGFVFQGNRQSGR
jgi:MFS family permease